MAVSLPGRKPKKLRLHNPVTGLSVIGRPAAVVRWHVRNPPRQYEGSWERARVFQRPVKGGVWLSLGRGPYASWVGELICHYRREAKRREVSEAAKAANKTRTRGLVRSSASSSQPQEEATVAKTKSKKSKKSKDEVEQVVDDEELEGLEEELEELEGLDEGEDEEPDEVDEDEDDDDEEDEDEDDAEAKKKARAKARREKRAKGKGKKSRKAKDDDDDDEEEDEKPKRSKSKSKKSKSKSNGKGKKGGTKPGTKTSDLGGVGATELAEEAGVTPRDVRVYLRKNEVEKDEESGRYRWPSTSNKTFQKLVKQIKAASE